MDLGSAPPLKYPCEMINKLMEDQMKEIPQNLQENAMDLKTLKTPLKIVEISQLL